MQHHDSPAGGEQNQRYNIKSMQIVSLHSDWLQSVCLMRMRIRMKQEQNFQLKSNAPGNNIKKVVNRNGYPSYIFLHVNMD